MAEKQPTPEIRHSYRLQGDDKKASTVFSLAGITYGETRIDEEEVSVNLQPRNEITMVTYGRKVLETLNRYDFERASDNMRGQIEGIVASYGYGDVVARSYAGRHTPGPVPEQE